MRYPQNLHSLPSDFSRLVALALVALTVLASVGVPLTAQEPSIAAQVVRMLDAELSEEVILEWLRGQPEASEPLSADDLVALKGAGASDDLLKEMLAIGRGGEGTEEAPAPPVPPPAPSVGSEPVGEREQRARVTFHLAYLTQIDEAEVTGPKVWDFYIYLDGIPVTFMDTARLANEAATMEFERELPAGRHILRVAQELHYQKGGRWQHETRAAPNGFIFDLSAGVPARLEVEFRERLMDYQDPLEFKLTQGERVQDSGRVGGIAERWPAICQDIDASVPSGKKPNRRQRQRRETCVDWDSWWGDTEVPPRGQVLDAMAAFDYRPRPKGS
jgi:hypothetical protein